MATGTPIIGRRAGGVTETVEHGLTGFLVDDLVEAELAVRNLADLDRVTVRARVIERFLPARMVDKYEVVYRRLSDADSDAAADRPRRPYRWASSARPGQARSALRSLPRARTQGRSTPPGERPLVGRGGL